MINKKSNLKDLEKKRIVFFQIGLMISLALMITAFESGRPGMDVDISDYTVKPFTSPVLPPISYAEEHKPAPKHPEFKFVIDEKTESEIDLPDFSKITYEEFVYPEFEPEEYVDDIPTVVLSDEMPKYNGGDKSKFQKHIQSLVKYPERALELNISGQVIIEFVVDENGNILNPKILRSPDELLSEAVLDALKKTYQWVPGKNKGNPVRIRYAIPVYFKINN